MAMCDPCYLYFNLSDYWLINCVCFGVVAMCETPLCYIGGSILNVESTQYSHCVRHQWLPQFS